MHPSRSRRPGRSGSTPRHLSLLVLLLLTPFAALTPATAQRDDRPFDLAAMALRPADLADEGVEGLGVSFSVLSDDADEVGDYVAFANIDPGSDDASAYVASDADMLYILDLDNLVPAGESESAYYTQVVETFVLVYGDEEDAQDGLEAMAIVWSESDMLAEGDLSADIGDGAVFLEGEGIDNAKADPTERTLLVFQRDAIVAGILTYNSVRDGTFDQDTTEALAHVMLERIDDGLDGNTPDLSTRIVRPDVPAINSWYDQYLSIDGIYFCPSEIVSRGECQISQDLVDDYNELSRYYVETRISGDFDIGVPESHIVTSVWMFLDEDSARARFEEMRNNRPTEGAEITNFDLGDESIGWNSANDDFMRATVLVRMGNTIFEIRQSTEYALAAEQGWTFEPSADAVYELAELQLSCLEGTVSCAEPVEIPNDMLPDDDTGETREQPAESPNRPAHQSGEGD